MLRGLAIAGAIPFARETDTARAEVGGASPATREAGTRGAPPPANAPGGSPPSWMAGMRVGEWRRVPNSAPATLGSRPFAGTYGAPANHLAYSGAALKRDGSWLLQFGGGHADYSGNDVLGISLEQDAPAWRVLRGPTVPPRPDDWSLNEHPEYKGVWWDAHHLPDGRPASRHSGSALQYIDGNERLMSFYNTSAFGTSSTTTTHVDAFRWADKDWDPAGTWPNLPGAFTTSFPWTVKDSEGDDVYIGVAGAIYRWHHRDGRFTPVFHAASWSIDHGVAGIDVPRNRLLIVGIWNDPTRATAQVIGLADGRQTFVKLVGPFADRMATPLQVGAQGFDWCPDLQRFLFFPDDGHTYTVDAATLEVDRLSVSGARPPAESRYSAVNGSGLHGRFRYVPRLRGCVLLANWKADLWFLKTG